MKRDGTGDRLPYPPRRIRRKLISLGVVELFDRLHQTDVSLLNQIEKRNAAPRIFFGDADHKAQIALDQLIFGVLVAVCHAFGKL